jgi:hypothetical protein
MFDMAANNHLCPYTTHISMKKDEKKTKISQA